MVLKKLKQYVDPTYVDSESLLEFATVVFNRAGLSREDAAGAAEVLVEADLAGADSHGICYSFGGKVRSVVSGGVNPTPDIRIVHETPSTALVDGNNALGLMGSRKAMEIAIAKAHEVGTGTVALRNSSHCGMIAFYPTMALEHDMIGLAMSTTPGSSITPTFAKDSILGTNPIGFAVPAGDETPFILDIATSVVASGKIAIARALGVDVPEGWRRDDDDNPVTDVEALGGSHGLPLGGSRELGSHKGYGIALMVDVLCGVLSGNGAGFLHAVPRSCSQYFQAIRIDAFRPADEFKRDMDLALRTLRELEPTTGNDQVYYAGMQRAALKADRIENGIPLPQHTVGTLKDLASEFEVEFPRVI
jgi:L-2-hydroxycarboxylate dehydrogenase (NAD+)